MVGKTFKGMTDELLDWQTERAAAARARRRAHREAHVVHVRPELVVEIAVDGVQRSTRYPGGVALRFARVRRYREDKRAERGGHDREGPRTALIAAVTLGAVGGSDGRPASCVGLTVLTAFAVRR